MSGIDSKHVLLGVCGGIAAYKSAELVRRLRDAGAQVRVVMTDAATRFVTPLTFQALSGHPVRQSLWDEAAEAAMGHIELARWADQIVIAPASANTLAKLAHGLADDLLTTLVLASDARLTVAPAMNRQMWAQPATQASVQVLRERGAQILGPADGSQACGEVGPGRMLEPQAILQALLAAPQANGLLSGYHLLISAGPTYEDIDPVRFVGNRSSGKMGFALAAGARQLGAQVHLITGPTALETPIGVRRTNVRSAAQMHQAVMAALQADRPHVYIGAAAVADYTPASVAEQKIKKIDDELILKMTRTADVLAQLSAHPLRPAVVVGFAAETNDVEHYARGKLEKKKLDMIVANRVGQTGRGFDADDNEVIVLCADSATPIPLCSKTDLAQKLLEKIAARLAAKVNP